MALARILAPTRAYLVALALSVLRPVAGGGGPPPPPSCEAGGACSAAGARPEWEHWWPRCHGIPGAYGYTNLTGPWDSTTRWSWQSPSYRVVLGSLIDYAKNIYVTVIDGIRKFSPEGELLWYYQPPGGLMTKNPSLLGGFIYGDFMSDSASGERSSSMVSVDIASGEQAWRKQVFSGASEGDTAYVEAYDGVVIGVYDQQFRVDRIGNVRIIAANASDGSILWEYVSGEILWNFQATFLGDGTFLAYDVHGGVRRIRMADGSLVWRARPKDFLINTILGVPLNSSYSDGGVTVAPDGEVAYTCANLLGGTLGTPGALYAYRVEDGLLLWQQALPLACVSWPAVDPTGSFVAVVLGPFAAAGYSSQMGLMAFDAKRGGVKWVLFDLPLLFNGALGDPEHSEVRKSDEFGQYRQACGPASWGAPMIDAAGTVYAGNHNGFLYAVNDFNADGIINATEYKFVYVNESSLHCGAGFAPGMMVYASCAALHVFRYPA